MGKPRRPRGERSTGDRPASRRSSGPRATWEPAPPPDPADPVPAAETAASPVAEAAAPPAVPVPIAEPAIPALEALSESIAAPADLPAPVERVAEAEPVISVPVAEPVAPPPALPALIAEPPVPAPGIPGPEVRPAPVARAAAFRIGFAPERLDVAGIGATVAGYVRGESEAVAAHLRALSEARSPADVIRLQVGEIQRAADASLTCWSTVARKVGRIFAFR
jgi:hypothetical protein